MSLDSYHWMDAAISFMKMVLLYYNVRKNATIRVNDGGAGVVG